MNKIITILLLSILSIGCGDITSTTKMELRQLVSKEVRTKNSDAYYFLIAGSYHSGEKSKEIIKMFVKVDNKYYKLLKLNLEDVNIVIDNKINKPYLIILFTGSWKQQKDSEIISSIGTSITIYLHCPERYLPEKLLNIELN